MIETANHDGEDDLKSISYYARESVCVCVHPSSTMHLAPCDLTRTITSLKIP